MNSNSLAIVMEWENVFLSEDDRPFLIFEELKRQVQQLRHIDPDEHHNLDINFLRSFIFPVDLRLVFNHDWDGNKIANSVEAIFEDVDPNIQVSLLPTAEGKYYDLKNYGAKDAAANLIIFLDTDAFPESNWLINILTPFSDPDISGICGRTIVDHTNWYTKSYSLIKFQLPATTFEIEPIKYLFANNLAVRKPFFDVYKFPVTGKYYKIPSREYLRTIKKEGLPVFHNPAAIVRHPAPLPNNFLKRAFYHGRDKMMDRQDLKRTASIDFNSAEPTKNTFLGIREFSIGWRRLTSVFRN